MSGLRQQQRYQITRLSWNASINAWAMKDVMHRPATDCDCSECVHDGERKDKESHTGGQTYQYSDLSISQI